MPERIRAVRRKRSSAPRGSGAGGEDDGLISRSAVALLVDPRLGSATSPQRARLIQGLQERHGNAYVARLVQRAAALADAPPAQKLEPEQDAKFVAVEKKIGITAHGEKKHDSAKSKAAEAQAAAHGPADDVASQADAAQVEKMAQAKPGEFDKKAFIEAVKKAVDAAAPKNLSEAADFKDSGKAGQVKGQVAGLVTNNKQQSEASIKQASSEAPDSSKAKPKQVKPFVDEKAGGPPGDAGAAQAIPSSKPASETSMDAGPAEVNQQMAQADVSEQQLKDSNEPQFNDALDAKKKAEDNSKQAPQDYRATETEVLAKAGGDAKGTAGAALNGMHATRASALASVTGHKSGAKAQDEAKRAEVAAKIETIFGQTRTEVTAILSGLDQKVNAAFDSGEKAAREQFENYVDQQMSAYKDKRYSGLLGKGRWLKDKLMGMPSEVNAFYQEGRNRYLKQMEVVIGNVADIVGGELGRARARIAQGRQQVKDFVASQPKALQQVAKAAEQQIGGKFDQLDSDVNSKQEGLVQTLADKYVAARDSLDQRIDELKAQNKGLVDAVKDAIGGVIQTIMHLKDMLLNVLSKAAGVIGDIIRAPIKFLGNLVGAIKQGLGQFVSNIGTHLKKGLMGWLFGTLGDAGITLPDSFDLKGIVSLVLQILGLTYDNIRAIAVKIAGEKVVAAVEGTVKFFTTLAKEGAAGLWEWIKEKIDEINIKDVVIGAIKDFVITRIIMAGVQWLIGLLNPAAAFIKACKMIYDVIMFFIERGSQIMEFVNSILDSVGAIVAGNIGAAANLVENSLAKILPLAISFLASLLGVGGIAEKIKEIIDKIRAPINKLVSSVLGVVLKPIKSLYEKGAKFVKGVVDKGKALGQKAIGKVKGMFGGDKSAGDTDASARVKAKAHEEMAALTKQPFASVAQLHTAVGEVLKRLRPEGLKDLRLEPKEGAAGKYNVLAAASPETKVSEAEVSAGGADETGALAVYRGLHFKSTLNQTEYDRQLRENLVGQPTFSAAAQEVAGKSEGGPEPSRADLETAAEIVQAEVKRTQNPSSVKQWWGKKSQVFDSFFAAMLQRYVNTYDAFKKELKPGGPVGGLGFHSIPFISTSKSAIHAARYAIGDKFIKPEEIRSEGVVGRLLVYVFSVKELKDQGAIDVQAADKSGQIKVKARIFNEGEVAFTGSIPGENLVGQEDASEDDSAPELADRGQRLATQKAAAQGGLKQWPSD